MVTNDRAKVRKESLEAGRASARRIVAAQARRAARKGLESNVTLFPTARKVPTVAAYARAKGMGSDPAWANFVDLKGLRLRSPGYPRGCATILFTPQAAPIRVFPGKRVSDVVAVGLKAMGGRLITELRSDDPDDTYFAVTDALGSDEAGLAFWQMLTDLGDLAVKDGWIRRNPLRDERADETDDFDPGTDDDPEPIAVGQ